MKKVFTKLGIILITSATILPLSACTFNFYVNRVTNSIAKSFADQTSALIKSMVMSKELDVDTSSTNDYIMDKIKNNSINNLTKNTSLNNWGDLQTRWGENGKININGFDADNFFKASGTGQLTKSINSKKQINDVFSSLDYIRTISIMTNPQLVNIVLGAGMDPISSFLKSLQGNLSNSPAGLQLVANLINNYGPNFLSPLTRIFGNLVNGSWSEQQIFTPTDEDKLTKFMNDWKDDSGQPYSAWNNGEKWKIDPHATVLPLFPGHKVKDWKPKQDYHLYHGGTLINYLFWKMSKDNNIFGKDGKTVRYLGDIIADYTTISGDLNDPKFDFDDKAFFVDIEKYFPYLLTNPLYILTIIEAIIPVIKKWILDMPDITQGVKNLTIGHGYPSKPSDGSYNLLDIINTIKSLINQREKLKQILLTVFGKSTAETRGFDTFLYDLKLNAKIGIVPLQLDLGGVIGDKKYDPSPLIDTIINAINTDSVKNTIDSISHLITKISEQYPSNEGINIDLQNLKNFLFDNNNALLIILKNDTIGVLQNIIKKNDVVATDVENLYKSLGGNTKQEEPEFPTFTSGSILDILQKTMFQPDSQLNNILNLLLGTTDENHKLGIKNIITENNNQWIKDNYDTYFDADNTIGINKKIGNTYNIIMTKNTINNIETINLKYDFTYKIKNTKYHFNITGINIENLIDFQGIRTFKFKSITLEK